MYAILKLLKSIWSLATAVVSCPFWLPLMELTIQICLLSGHNIHVSALTSASVFDLRSCSDCSSLLSSCFVGFRKGCLFARVFFRSSFSNVFQPWEGKAQEALQLGIQDLLTAEGRVLQLSHSLSEEGLKHGDAITATGLKHGDWTGLVIFFGFVQSMRYQLYMALNCHCMMS